MNDITAPLRLAVGSHEAGSGKGCAMNLISRENGDTTITDFPSCSDPVLARIVQSVNDTICKHRDGDLLCSPCSLEVLALGHRTVGTGFLPMGTAERRRVLLAVANDAAVTADVRVPGHELTRQAWFCLTAAEREAKSPQMFEHNVGSAIIYSAIAISMNTTAIGATRLNLAHRAIDLFEKLTVDYRVEVTREISASDVEQAYACMTA